MLPLLKIQYQVRKQLILLYFVIIVGIGIYFSTKDTMLLPLFCYIFSVNFLSHTFLSSHQFYRLLAIMPIEKGHIVKCIALFSFLFIIVTFIIILPFQLKDDYVESISLLIGFFSCAIVSSAVGQSFLFTNEKFEIGFGENMLSMFASLLILFPHALFYWIEHEPTFYLRLLLAPTLALAFYYWRMKVHITYLEKREIF